MKEDKEKYEFRATLSAYRGCYILSLVLVFLPILYPHIDTRLEYAAPVYGILAIVFPLSIYYWWKLKKLTGLWTWW